MADELEKITGIVYKNWQNSQVAPSEGHPDEETLVAFLEKKLPEQEYRGALAHFASCQNCLERISFYVRSGIDKEIEIPQDLIARAKGIVSTVKYGQPLEIVLRVRGKVLELLESTGDVLVGQELVPSPVLRSRKIKDFKDQVIVLKDFSGIRVEIKVDSRIDNSFNVYVSVKDKLTGLPLKDFRVTLLQEEKELESYLARTGVVIFEDVLLGRYSIAIANPQERLASVNIDIRK